MCIRDRPWLALKVQARGQGDQRTFQALRAVSYTHLDVYKRHVLQITDKPPKGRPFERIDREPQPGIKVSGERGN